MAEDLPEELIFEILNKTSPESLLRCTSVCKSWYSHITSPRFINTLLLANNVEKKVILFGDQANKYSIHRDNEAFDKIFDVDPPLGKSSIIRNVCSYNGLICMYVTRLVPCGSSYMESNVYLWNPSIRRLFPVPQPPVDNKRVLDGWGFIGFGFIPECNDYKIVNIKWRKAEVYELSNGSWKDIKNSKKFLGKYRLDDSAKQCFVNDTIHWVGRDANVDNRQVIVTFDVKKDELGVLMMPSSIYDYDNTLHVVPRLFQDFFSLVQHKIKERTSHLVCVWVMNEYGVFDSWTKNVLVGIPGTPLLIRHNGEALLINRFLRMTFDLFSCDFKNQYLKYVVTNTSYVQYADNFVQSLVLLDKLEDE